MKKTEDHLIYNLENLHMIESTHDEEDSFYIYNNYQNVHENYLNYVYPKIDISIVQSIFNDYSLFYGRIQETLNSPSHNSPFPLGVIRFMIDADLSCNKYYTPKRKPGWVIEGYFWTNGFVRRIREDKTKDFQVHEISCLLHPSTAHFMNLSLPEKYATTN